MFSVSGREKVMVTLLTVSVITSSGFTDIVVCSFKVLKNENHKLPALDLAFN